jgi:membrane protein
VNPIYAANAATDQPLRDLLKRLGEDASLLVRQEAQLARGEIEKKISTAGKEALALAAGAAVAYAGFLAISAGIILVLSLFIATWLAALLVGAGLLAGGAGLLLIGKYGLSGIDPVPRNSVESVRADFRALQHAAR